jgi:hypothetical protein
MFDLSRTIGFFVCLKTILSFEKPENTFHCFSVYAFLVMHFRNINALHSRYFDLKERVEQH